MGNKNGKQNQDFRRSYRLGRKLGEGAFGVVHECRKRDPSGKDLGGDDGDAPFAVKMIDRAESDTTGIEREVMIMGQLDHVNVVKCLDIFVEKCFVCIVMPKYSGGDLVDGLQLHLRNKGKIPETVCADLSRQMFSAVLHLHNKQYLHRDIKGDNLLMDRPDLSDPLCHIVLSDFGTCIQHQPGKFLRQLTGTRVFWSPEVVQRRYSFSADVWACGVVLYGLINATFPFKDEAAIIEKSPRIPGTVSPEGKDIIMRILEKDPEKRITLDQTLKHPWTQLTQRAQQQQQQQVQTQQVQQQQISQPAQATAPEEGGSINRDKVPQAMALRRREMATLYAKNQQPQAKQQQILKEIEAKLKQCQDFSCEGLHAGEIVSYKWFAAKDAEKHYTVSGNQITSSDKSSKQFVWTPKTLKDRLEKANISTNGFGQGKAKTLSELCDEITTGECSLMHDTDGSFTSNKIVRVVEVVLLRITNKATVLIETKEKYADGRDVDRNRLPGTKQRPNENLKATTERILETILNVQKGKISFDFSEPEIVEEKENSPSYPGVITVYRKKIIQGSVLPYSMSQEEWSKIGGEKCETFQTTGPKKEVKTWCWLTAKEISKKKIKVEGKKQSDEISALVPAVVKMEEDSLKSLLEEHNIDASKMYGKGEAKTLFEFAQEIARGECFLQSDNNVLTRVVDVVLLKVTDRSSSKVLLEVSRKNEKTGGIRSKDQLPGAKSRPNENIYATARRVCNVLLNIRDDYLTFGSHTLIEEESQSSGYPGMVTCYRKHIISAKVEGEGSSA